MATRLYGFSRGEALKDVTEGVGSAVASDSVELTVDLASSLSKLDVLKALDMFRAYIAQDQWPPA